MVPAGAAGPSLTRRGLTIGLSALFGAAAVPAPGSYGSTFEEIERLHGGRLGMFVLDTGSGRTLAHRADERFCLCSTFKGILAAMILSRVDAGHESLARLVPYGANDLLPASPVTRAHVRQGALTTGELCAAILEYSDNGAANLLLARVGGPRSLTAYARSLGDTVTRFDRYEPVNSDRSSVLDTTTPRAIAGLARTVVLGDALSARSRARLEQWMAANVVGRRRLRASFPPSWKAADRTGTADGFCNDYAVVRPPGRAPLVTAAYYDAPGMEMARQEAVLREVGSAVVAWAA